MPRESLLLSSSLFIWFVSAAEVLLGADRQTLALGAAAPDFDLPGVDYRRYTLASFADAKVLAVIFTSNHCPTAQAYEERIKQLVADYRPRGVAFVAINPNHAPAVRLDEMGFTDLGDTMEEMRLRTQERNYNFPYLDDGPTQSVTEQYGPVATPHIFIFDGTRRLRFQGRIDDAERESLVKTHDARNALDAVLAGRAPAVATTKVFGCSIKWKEKAADNQRWRERVAAEPVTLTPVDVAGLRELRANKSGKVRVVNFWATWCGPCVAEFADLVETNLRFRHRDFEMVTVAADHPDQHERSLRFLERHRASTRNLIFADANKYPFIEAFDPEWSGAIPYTVILAPGGEILYRSSGANDFLALRRGILPALDAVTPWPASGGG